MAISFFSLIFFGMEWNISSAPVPYASAIAFMEERVRLIAEATADEAVWLLEHPALYTKGTSGQEGDLLAANGLPVIETGRGGQYTYHGPGQRIAYVMLDLKKRRPDLHWFIAEMQRWVIAALAEFGVQGEMREGRVGVWVVDEALGTEAKIAAIGVRVRRWVSFHGVAINIAPDLRHYAGIVPCGIREHGVTSFQALGVHVSVEQMDAALQTHFPHYFVEKALSRMDANEILK